MTTDPRQIDAPRTDLCGAWGFCVLPKGHNMGRPDIPENHSAVLRGEPDASMYWNAVTPIRDVTGFAAEQRGSTVRIALKREDVTLIESVLYLAAAPQPRDATPADSLDALRALVADGIEAIRLTREYVDPTGELLPPLPGWSWFDWTERARAALRAGESRSESSKPLPPPDPSLILHGYADAGSSKPEVEKS